MAAVGAVMMMVVSVAVMGSVMMMMVMVMVIALIMANMIGTPFSGLSARITVVPYHFDGAVNGHMV